MKKLFTKYVITLLLLLCSTSSVNASTQVTTQESKPTNHFIGEWSFLIKYSYHDDWFAINIFEETLKGHYKGFITDSGTLLKKKGTFILAFHQVGDEYWGEITTSESAIACKVLIESSSKINIVTPSGKVFRGIKLNKCFKSEDSETKAITEQNSNPTTVERKSASSLSSKYSNDSGYGEISKATGRPKTVHVNGYYRKDGTYVKSHYRISPNK